jgi:hypothetical protein
MMIEIEYTGLLPRVGSLKPPVGVLEPGFTMRIVNSGGGLRVFLESTVSSEILFRGSMVLRNLAMSIANLLGGYKIYVPRY